ncbi:MAG: hypothetical protein GXC78_05685 [Chitinophagaceae bacterium]|jgi:hypothetical protein|nr:hypothetical protein [Chitinophagaceae bacterium]
MKIIERDIPVYLEKHFVVPIRDKADYAKVLALSARQLLLESEEIMIPKANVSLKLIVDKMSRLFIYNSNKYYSISFPFTVFLDDKNVLEISTYSGKSLDNKRISAIISILDSNQFNSTRSLIDFYIEPLGIESSGIYLLEEIFQFEPSYIRYDNDPENENGRLHPLNHFDVNYSQHSTFKIGLSNSISRLYFEDFQNINTDCRFIADKVKDLLL